MEEKQTSVFANYSAMVAIGAVLTLAGFVLGFGAEGAVNVVMVLGMLLVIVGYLRRIARALER
ncbi:hypothetical protein E7744_06975 [Citricoccus sp. SGAir0253]|uniref:hypothetical protein n=1 Tax=Citricoccus sp. SGAir0253 TaxID=2567881 RepID=UPI0010CCC68D|nr:hypothetical protein [Citricoccus sp. SGAir0253]QCU77954.1 hypothetical protein E7744_06975 [Citricoccus sp. SGAir0253]